MEKKCVDLEGQLSTKDKALNSVEEKLRSTEENVALVVVEKDKQTSDLMSFQRANEDLKVQLRDLDKRLKEAESKSQSADAGWRIWSLGHIRPKWWTCTRVLRSMERKSTSRPATSTNGVAPMYSASFTISFLTRLHCAGFLRVPILTPISEVGLTSCHTLKVNQLGSPPMIRRREDIGVRLRQRAPL